MVPQEKVCLVVIDGWGCSSPDPSTQAGDAIHLAHTPTMDSLTTQFGCCPLTAHGEAVGLPAGLMGNSEVGHLNIGAGRVVYQDILRIDKLLGEDTTRLIDSNEAFSDVVKTLNERKRTLHLVGLLSDGGVHSHLRHLLSLLSLFHASGIQAIAIHAITDGRDTAPKCAQMYIDELQEYIETNEIGARLATICGRYWAMDRDKRWERTRLACDAFTQQDNQEVVMLSEVSTKIQKRYEEGETDEFLKPILIEGTPRIASDDVLVFFNFRSDRMRQLVQVFGTEQLKADLPFESKTPPLPSNLHLTTMTRYREDFPFPLLSPPQAMLNVLAETLSHASIKQLHVAETEKFSHVTVFFNGGREEPFEGETRILVPSPKVATYDLAPEMASAAVAGAVVNALATGEHGFVMCNFAPPDMVGHTGILAPTIKAVEATDIAIGRIYSACQVHGYTLAITADHGNAEKMISACGKAPHKAHTCAKVPFILAKKGVSLVGANGEPALCDVAPTVLALMGVIQPTEMTGQSLI